MEIDEALAFYATTETVDLVRGLQAGHALAAEVRRYRAMRCDTCFHQWQRTAGLDLCGRVSVYGHSVARVACAHLGGGCLAWVKRNY